MVVTFGTVQVHQVAQHGPLAEAQVTLTGTDRDAVRPQLKYLKAPDKAAMGADGSDWRVTVGVNANTRSVRVVPGHVPMEGEDTFAIQGPHHARRGRRGLFRNVVEQLREQLTAGEEAARGALNRWLNPAEGEAGQRLHNVFTRALYRRIGWRSVWNS